MNTQPANGRLVTPYRGRKEDMPRLFVCEVAYCWDTREVFIGTSKGNIQVHSQQLIGDLKALTDQMAATAMEPAVVEPHKRRQKSRECVFIRWPWMK